MTRFIIVTFLFMGFAFYELSGGADFEPRGVRAPKIAKVAAPEAAKATEETQIQVTRVTDPVIAPRKPRTVETSAQSATGTDATVVNVSLSGLGNNSPVQGLQLASLSDGLAGLQTTPQTDVAPQDAALPRTIVEPKPDMREIKGTRVNMRQGPGTNFPVITRLTLGHKVEVLSDSGTGWLRLRVQPEGTIGWISASLITKKAQ